MMHLITLFRVRNPHQRCLQAQYRNEPKQVMPKSEDPSSYRSLEINAIWTFDTEFLVTSLKQLQYDWLMKC